jgi:hypothetical protein
MDAVDRWGVFRVMIKADEMIQSGYEYIGGY